MTTTAAEVWTNRIVGSGVADPAELAAHPLNWRVHPKAQEQAMAEVLDKVGWVQEVIINRQTGHILDGHMRVSLAAKRGEVGIPVKYVDLTPEEEELVLATYDPLGAWAIPDSLLLSQLQARTVNVSDLKTGSLAQLLGVQPQAPSAVSTAATEAGGPTQEQLTERQAELQGEFAERAREREAGMIGLTCPSCGADFQLARADVLKEAVEP